MASTVGMRIFHEMLCFMPDVTGLQKVLLSSRPQNIFPDVSGIITLFVDKCESSL